MDFFVKFKGGEELELVKGITGVNTVECWRMVGFNYPQVSMPEPYKRLGSADPIESLFIKIIKPCWKKISETGLIYLTNGDFEIQQIVKKKEVENK